VKAFVFQKAIPLLVRGLVLALVLAWVRPCVAQEPEWQLRVRVEVANHRLNEAQAIVEQRLSIFPDDLEAHGWRARLLAWTNHWSEAEMEYEFVLGRVPNDTEILTALSDVLLWQNKYEESLQTLDRARAIAPTDPEILVRRARVLFLLKRAPEARLEYLQTLKFDPNNPDARAGVAELRPAPKHEFRAGNETDFFSYTDAAQTQEISLNSRWDRRWSTLFMTNFYQRFGEAAAKFTANAAYHFSTRDFLGAGAALANQQTVAPTSEAFCEYGHAFQFKNRWIAGLESSYQQHWYWYQGAHVLTLTGNNLIYLRRTWTLSLTVTGARTGFAGTAADWVPSGWTRLGFPLRRYLNGNLFYAVGSENFSQVDQIGRFAAHTWGAGLRYQLAPEQDVTGYVSRQVRTHDQTETSFGVSYGIHF
jgi:tetratricopeptide (TPR) repeat protein